MARKRYSAKQINGKLREAEIPLAGGQTVGQVWREAHYDHAWVTTPGATSTGTLLC